MSTSIFKKCNVALPSSYDDSSLLEPGGKLSSIIVLGLPFINYIVLISRFIYIHLNIEKFCEFFTKRNTAINKFFVPWILSSAFLLLNTRKVT